MTLTEDIKEAQEVKPWALVIRYIPEAGGIKSRLSVESNVPRELAWRLYKMAEEGIVRMHDAKEEPLVIPVGGSEAQAIAAQARKPLVIP